jgi:endonuclease III
LVAVALSAQTTDKKVNEVTPKLFSVAPNPEKMAALEEPEIKELIKEIGLSTTKAKNLKIMANQLLERHNGEVPSNFEDLENLAGVGHKTASVVMSQAFGVPAFPVDTHIHRLMKQWKLTEGKTWFKLKMMLKNFSQKKLGINFTFKLFSTAENILQPEEIRRKITLRKCFLRNNQIFRVPLLEGCQNL